MAVADMRSLSIPMEASPDETATPFGAQLLDAVKRQGLPLGGFEYSDLQELKRADREQAVRILRREIPGLSYVAVQRLKSDSPKQIARDLAQQAQIASAQMSMVMLFAMF